MQEDREAKAVKKFGDKGLEVKFGVRAAGQDGCNHKVDIYMSDSIREFKRKLTLACEKEVNYWKDYQGDSHKNVQRYQDIQIGSGHLVMVYVTPSKVQKMASQGLEGGEEYKRQYALSLLDPLNWQPLDPMQSFDGYSYKYAFGKARNVPKIQVVEATESYKLTNLRYRAFEEERKRDLMTDKNDSEKCYGWAQFEHDQDGKSVEWRPALISKFNEASAAQQVVPTAVESNTAKAPPTAAASAPASKYQVTWLFAKMMIETRTPNSLATNADPDEEKNPEKSEDVGTPNSDARVFKSLTSARTVVLDASKVILAPRNPKMDVWFHPKHEEVLQQARGLRNMGKSDFDIEAMLQKTLDDEWNAEHPSTASTVDQMRQTKPPKITVEIIRNYLDHHST